MVDQRQILKSLNRKERKLLEHFRIIGTARKGGCAVLLRETDFCFPCLLFSVSSGTAWVKGYCDLNNLAKALSKR